MSLSLENLMFEAVKFNHVEVLKFLVLNGADVRVMDDYALRWARYHKHFEIVKYLESIIAKDKNVNL